MVRKPEGDPVWERWKRRCVCAQSCPTLCDPMDCNLPGSSVHGILQARILEWVSIPFSNFQGNFLTQGLTRVSYIEGGFFYHVSYQGRPQSVPRKCLCIWLTLLQCLGFPVISHGHTDELGLLYLIPWNIAILFFFLS